VKRKLTGFVLLLLAGVAYAAEPPLGFSGNRVFDPAHSKNVGIMAQ
jgi:hypothetical protein